MEEIVVINIFRVIIGSVILLYASYTDIKTRKADNKLWLIMGASGGILLILQWIFAGFENIYYLIFVPLMIGFIYLLFQIRLIYGGADAKALMALSILAPVFPNLINFPILGDQVMSFQMPFLVVFY